ncbi:MAG: tripartite tricarboxylate transporter permease [Rhizobiales bacterium]|nr:tripartite tricarboxylate transporter permease [Hyphomicrobiales bacterium]MBO6698540.1 tripartite tricarboxylate transporter permease [Hyphomicrobiales bacterium]MBO6735206.1 tripartite tricarboxylate transporter permease [Hyphomicrobiales bacterium]MBO6910986.1 tripartite tricarboxylate transporter permease [Hyphomicrobiales bacterium]MBO6956029.1 tripartite tricarboxylate transporter permease [Hyphomicrobiales bacterium]
MLEAVLSALTPFNLVLAFVGVVLGTLIGALPGLSATMAVAVLVPFTFTMDPASGLIALGAVYTGAIYGGAYAAILVNTPGTPAAIATSLDGFPMAKRGDGDLAVTISCFASAFGGIVGALALLIVAPPLATIALSFGPVEYFWLAIFGLSLIAVLSRGATLKGIIGGFIGLGLSTVGSAVIGGDVRYTFGEPALLGGIHIIPALIGIYCVPVLLNMVGNSDPHIERAERGRGTRIPEALGHLWRGKFNLVRSSVVGTVVGILPAAGGAVAGLVAYSEARRTSKHRKDFGKGAPDGVIASESANSATVGGGFVPTLVLGIPGTPPDAVILGALLVQGIRVGPQLFTEQADLVFTFVFGLLIATVLMIPTGLVIGRSAYHAISSIPKSALAPAIGVLIVIGSFAVEQNVMHVLMMVILGGFAWVALRHGFEPSPIVLGLILGPIAEQGFVQAWLIGTASGDLWGQYFGRPISLAIIFFTLLTLLWPIWSDRRAARKETRHV